MISHFNYNGIMGKILRSVGSFSQKILIVVFVYCAIAALFMLFTRDTNQPLTHNIHQDIEARMYRTINDPEMKKTSVGRNTLVFYRFALCTVVGMTCTDDPADNAKLFDHSLIGFMTNTMSATYTNPPLS